MRSASVTIIATLSAITIMSCMAVVQETDPHGTATNAQLVALFAAIVLVLMLVKVWVHRAARERAHIAQQMDQGLAIGQRAVQGVSRVEDGVETTGRDMTALAQLQARNINIQRRIIGGADNSGNASAN